MKTEAEFRGFFERAILPKLEHLEERRAGVVRTTYQVLGGTLLGTVAITGLFALLLGELNAIAVFVPLVLGIVATLLVHSSLSKEYVSVFKKEAVTPLVSFFGEGLRYRPQSSIGQADFREGGLFRQQIDRYRGEDLVEGTIGKTDFRFSEIHAEYKTTTRTKNSTQTQWHTIFKGIYFIADFHKDFRGVTRVVPDTAERALGSWIGGMFQKASTAFSDVELVRLEDPEFEREFAVYGSDQIEARYVLSTSLMARIMDYRKRSGNTMWLAFYRSQVHVALATTRNMLEPHVWSTILDYRLFETFFRDLNLVISIIDELNLNLRIWTKE